MEEYKLLHKKLEIQKELCNHPGHLMVPYALCS